MIRQFLIIQASIFVGASCALFLLCRLVPTFSFPVLETANAIMLLLCSLAWVMVYVQTGERKNTSAFIRGVSGATFLKLMACMISILAYVMLNRDTLHKATIFAFMGIYAIYTTAETILLTRLAKMPASK